MRGEEEKMINSWVKCGRKEGGEGRSYEGVRLENERERKKEVYRPAGLGD